MIPNPFDTVPGRCVVVAGDVMLDRYLMGDAVRLSPEAPVPVVSVHTQHTVLGGAANVAANAAAMGAEVVLVGAIGADEAGRQLAALVEAAGIRNQLVEAPRATTVKTRVVARGQQITRFDEEVQSALEAQYHRAFEVALLRALAKADVLIVQDYNKGALSTDTLGTVIAAARSWQIPVIVDPKDRPFDIYRGATLLKPNAQEFARAYTTQVLPWAIKQARPEQQELADQIRDALECWNVGGVLVTRGIDGMVLGYGRSTVIVPGRPVAVADVSGAGDTVAAWLGAMVAGGCSIVTAVEVANVAASIQVTKAGTAVVRPDEVMQVLQSGAPILHASS